jgi:hypothetical protein
MEVWLTCQHITNALNVVDKPYMEIWVIIACHAAKSSYHSQAELFYYHQINLANGAKDKYAPQTKVSKNI